MMSRWTRLCRGYCQRTMELPDMQEWIAGALQEVEEVPELEVEF